MKKTIRNCAELLILTAVFSVIFTSCNDFETDIRSADYPEQKIYMPTAYDDGIYMIDKITKRVGDTPTEGQPYRYTVDLETRKFNVPLAAFRGGIDKKGAVKVDIAVNTDTVSRLIEAGDLEDAEILPSAKYTVDQTVEIGDGKDYAGFVLAVDIDFLRSKAPDKKLAVGIGISSEQRKDTLSTTVVVIDTKMFLPVPDFSYKVGDTWKELSFTNTSSYAVSYTWDFGDGSKSTEESPVHTFPGRGKYMVTLKAKGLVGDEAAKTVEIPVPQISKISKSKWKVVAYDSQDDEWGFPVKNVFDDDVNTFWVTQWMSAQPPYPHWFIIDMGQPITIDRFECFRRQGNSSGQTEHQFLTSMDGKTWEDQGTYPFDLTTDAGQVFPMTASPRARYFKYVATQGNVFFAQLGEITVYGSLDTD
ncbi:MAG: discoidin domain-containing protein [Prolixibacteraceae bacterium]|jgi:hypothetical protein|nr:discoidin domain-containing protein [Prolixibacteraceae bacterium]